MTRRDACDVAASDACVFPRGVRIADVADAYAFILLCCLSYCALVCLTWSCRACWLVL